MKFNEISAQLDIFFSDDSEKDQSIPTGNKYTLSLNNRHYDDDVFYDDSINKQKHSRQGNKFMSTEKSKNHQQNLKVQNQFGFGSDDDKFNSNPLDLPSDQQSSQKFQLVSEQYFSVKSESKDIQKKPQKNKKTKKIKRQKNNEMKHTEQKSEKKKQRDRKVRTTVSEQKIKILQHLFPYIEKRIPYKDTLINLKDIAKIVNLGYSTILHKYKDYRRKGAVQKGLLLKSKDVKRKYHKSLVIEEHIKDALKQHKFRTAKQLAFYISQKHNIKVNRSIVSRHLNQMHRQRQCEQLADWMQQKQVFDPIDMVGLREFSRVFFGLKNQNFRFFYLTVIRLYLIDGKLLTKPPRERRTKTTTKINVVNVMVTTVENNLLYYVPINFQDDQQSSKLGYLSYMRQNPAYRALYDELVVRVRQRREQSESSNDNVYVVFPYEDRQRQFIYRQKVLRKLLNDKVNVLIIPPKLNHYKINFIHRWFFTHVFEIIQKQSYLDFLEFKQVLIKVMNEEQRTLPEFAIDMIHAIRRVQ